MAAEFGYEKEVHAIAELLIPMKEVMKTCAQVECDASEHELPTDGKRFRACSGCGLQVYCSTEVRPSRFLRFDFARAPGADPPCFLQCQRKYWKEHKRECKLMKARNFADLEDFRSQDNRRWAEGQGFNVTVIKGGGYSYSTNGA